MAKRSAGVGKRGGAGLSVANAQVKAERVLISQLVRDPVLQVREGLDPGTVKKYENILAADMELPPVAVVAVGEVFYLVDGWHRVRAHENRRIEQLLATITSGTLENARWAAALANMSHGLPLKSREVRRVFSIYIAARRHRDGKRYKSYREIALDLQGAIRHTTVRHWMKKDHPKIFAAMATGGDEEYSPVDGAWPLRSPAEHAEAAWGRNIDSAFAALEGVHTEQQVGLLGALLGRIREIDLANSMDDQQGSGMEFSF